MIDDNLAFICYNYFILPLSIRMNEGKKYNKHYEKYRETILANANRYKLKQRLEKQKILEKEIITRYLKEQMINVCV